jgi:ATP-binding cassette subfamily B protein
VAAFLAAGLLNWAASTAQTYTTGWVGERVLADLRRGLFGHLQRLSLGFYERNRAGAVISRLTNDVEALDQLVTEGATSVVQNTLLLVGSAVVLFVLDWRLALVTLSVFPLMSIATSIFRRRSTAAYRRVRERLASVTAALQEGISGMRVVQSFERQERNFGEFREVNDLYRAANNETVVLNGLYFPFVDFLSSAATAIVLGFGGYLIFDGSLTVGTLFAFVG